MEDRRGKRLADQTPRSRDEALRIENARLKKENELLKMERIAQLVQEIHREARTRDTAAFGTIWTSITIRRSTISGHCASAVALGFSLW